MKTGLRFEAEAAPRPALSVARRDGADFIEVPLAFTLSDGTRAWAGLRLSRRALVVTATEPMPVPDAAASIAMNLLLPFDGFDLRLPVAGQFVPVAGVPGHWRFEFTALDPRVELAIAQVLRGVLMGVVPGPEDIAAGWDAETPDGAGAAHPSPRRRPLLTIGCALLLIAGLAALCHQGYLALTQVAARAAAVSAQRIDILSAEFGTVAAGVLAAGAGVGPGDVLLRVDSPAVASLLAEADALPVADGHRAGRLAAARRRDAALTVSANCLCRVLWSAPAGMPVAPGTLVASLVVSDPAQLRVEALVPASVAGSLLAGQAAAIGWPGSSASIAASVETVRYDIAPVARVGLGPDRGSSATVVLKPASPERLPVPGTPVNVIIFK